MNEEGYAEKYCLVCDEQVQAYISTNYAVGQHGGIVIAKFYCSTCHCILKE